MSEDYYHILGVPRTATQEEIKRAYRRLAHQHHPDKTGGNEEEFKRINAAYQALNDAEKRRQYDQFGQTFDGSGPARGFQGFSDFDVRFEDLAGFGDVFADLFGQRRSRPRVRRGQDIGVDITITFRESAQGRKQDITFRSQQVCPHCRGNTAEPGTPIETCSTCQGRGVVSRSRQTPLGVFAQNTTCSTCGGEGKLPKQPCSECRGQGRIAKTRTLEVDIPAGIHNQQTIRLQGQGEAALRGGISGDLYVTVHVKPDENLERRGNDVYSSAEISVADAALGTQIVVETLAGETPLKIPAGTQPETELRLARQGFPDLQGGPEGDQVVRLRVNIPKRLSRRQRQLFESLRDEKPRRSLFS